MIAVRWVDSLTGVPAADWDAAAGELGLYSSHGWLLAMEADSGVSTRYLLVDHDGRLAVGLPVYRVDDESSEYYQPARHHEQLTGSGDWLLAGTRRAYRSGIAVRADLDPATRDACVRAALDAVLEHAATAGCRGVVWRYAVGASAALLCRHGGTAALDTAEAEILVPDGGLDAYLARFGARARWKLKHEMRVFEAAGYRLRRESLADCWPQLVPLLSAVQAKYGHHPPEERLANRLRQQAAAFGEHSVVFRADADGRACAFTLTYVWGGSCWVRMVGFDYPRLRRAFEYFNLTYYEPIRYLAHHGLGSLQLGIESLPAKVARGAVLHPLWTVAVPCEPGTPLRAGPAAADPGAWLARWPDRALRRDEWNLR